MLRMQKRIVLLFLVLLMSGTGCYKELPEEFPTRYEWKPFLAFPIGEVDFGLVIPHGFDTAYLLQRDSLNVPLWRRLDTIPMAGGIAFDFNQVLGDRDEVDTAIFRVNAYNGFPTDIEIKGYILDENEQILDSLFNPFMLLKKAVLSSSGTTEEYVHTQENVYFGKERLDLLQDAKYIHFEGVMSPTFSFDQLRFKIQMGAVLGVVSEF